MNYSEHFRKEEHPFIEQVRDWKQAVETYYETKLTDFLDPREQDLLSMIIGKDETVRYQFHGGAKGAERKRACIYPFYEEITEDSFNLALYELSYPAKFVTLRHPDILGTLTGLGIKREKYGDIISGDGFFHCIVSEEVGIYMEMNLTKAGNSPVQLEKKPMKDALAAEENWEEVSSTITSFRLDVLIAEMYGVSRSKALPYIEKEKVKVNWKTITQSAYQVAPGDYISVRGMGRRKILSNEGLTKKGRYRLRYGKKKDQ